MLSTYVTSLIRTAVPIIVGSLLSLPGASWLVSALGITGDAARQQLATLLTFALSFLYYAIARAIESRWPKAGVLLGVAKAPTYGGGTAPTNGPQDGARTPLVPADNGKAELPLMPVAPVRPAVHGLTFTIPVGASLPPVVIRVSTEDVPAPAANPLVAVLPAAIGVNGSALRP